MPARFAVGATVRVTRNLRNDGTFPGLARGAPLVRRGSVGSVVGVGVFLQEQIVYSVHFLDDGRIVGCRVEELIDALDPWVDSRFEARERVVTRRTLAVDGTPRVAAGTAGEVMRVLREVPGGVQYHVRFPGAVLQVPEDSLAPAAAAPGRPSS
jgi:nitrogen fixation protein NifZ